MSEIESATSSGCKDHPNAPVVKACSECGLVLENRIVDAGLECQTSAGNAKVAGGTDPSRVGESENSSPHGSDLTRTSESGSGDGSQTKVGALKCQNRKNSSCAERALKNGFKEINDMADRLNLPRTSIDRANYLFQQSKENKHLKSRCRSNDSIASACLYISCRQEGVPRTIKEISSVSKVSKKEIGRCFKLILTGLDESVKIINTTDYIARFCTNLDLPKSIQECAVNIADKVDNLDLLLGRSPISVAAVAIYMASQAAGEKHKRTQHQVAHAAGVGDVTISHLYKALYKRAGELFPSNFQFGTPHKMLPQA